MTAEIERRPPPEIEAIGERFGVMRLRFVDDTGIASVWRGVHERFGDVAMKTFHDPGVGDEQRAAGLLRAYGGVGAARLYQASEAALVMEFLPGERLGDLCRRGEDAAASRILGDVARRLHALNARVDARPLTDVLEGLLREDLGAIEDDTFRGQMRAACAEAKALLSEPAPQIVLHGDLHFDNVLRTERGWLAIDPKCYLGDPAFELANAFRNPKGAEALVADPERIQRLAADFSAALNVDRRRLLRWAAVKCAHSLRLAFLKSGVWSRGAAPLPQLLEAAQ